MHFPQSVLATHKALSGLSDAQKQMIVEAVNRAKQVRFGICLATLPTVRFGAICSALRREYDKTKNPEYLGLLDKVIAAGLK